LDDDLTRLLLAARDGDRVALGAAIREAQADVWRMARHLVGPEDADDVTQDTFVRAWRALPAYRAEASGRTWLLSIARRACADAVRRRVRQRRLSTRLTERATLTSTSTPDTAGSHALEALLDTLEPDRREAFVLTQVAGCSYADAAEICGVPVGTIRSRVARAREDLVAEVRAAETA
jgi:RNA polymerase sigma-70 factor (ECF subfamily)